MAIWKWKSYERAPGLELQQWLGLVSVVWGAWVLSPWGTFVPTATGTELVLLGIMSLVVGALKVATARWADGMTRLSAVLSGLSWGVVLSYVIESNPASTGTLMYGSHACANLWLAFKK